MKDYASFWKEGLPKPTLKKKKNLKVKVEKMKINKLNRILQPT
jgi:hypothetical protein